MAAKHSTKPVVAPSHATALASAATAAKKASVKANVDDKGKFRVEIEWPQGTLNAMVPDPAYPVTFSGRPEFTEETKKLLLVNRNANSMEDRRHIVHWAEHLRPILESVFSDVVLKYRTKPAVELWMKARMDRFNTPPAGTPIPSSPLSRYRSKSASQLMLYLAMRVNSAIPNLVPDRADLNLAIEQVRGDVRRYQLAINSLGAGYIEANQPPSEAQRMAVYWAKAEEVFAVRINHPSAQSAALAANRVKVYGPADANDMMQRRREINSLIVDHIAACRSTDQLVMMLHDIVHTVTFDLSQKGRRDQTIRANGWLDTMRRNANMNADQRFDDLMAFIL